jgi:hypothetical protein
LSRAEKTERQRLTVIRGEESFEEKVERFHAEHYGKIAKGSEGKIRSEIARLATLSAVAYEPERKTVAEKLGIRVSSLDAMVASMRPKTETELRGHAVEIKVCAPSETAVDGSDLVTSIVDQIGAYVHVSENEKLAVAVWCIASHAFEEFYIFPRLRLKSATSGCGKSTLLDLVECIVDKPFHADGVTGPTLFRVIEQCRPCLLLDEADRYVRSNDDIVLVIDSGHKRNGRTLRCVGEEQEVRAFSTWAPMAIASIGRLTTTVDNRSIIVTLQRKPPKTTLKRFRGDRVPEALAALRSRCARWVNDHREKLAATDPEVPEAIANREADNWRPLLAVAETIGGEWPEKARKAALALRGGAEDELGVRLLGDIRDVFKRAASEAMHSVDLTTALNEIEGAPWSEVSYGRPLTQTKLGHMLGDFGIEPEQIKIQGHNRRGYRLASFAKAFASYFDPDPSPDPPSPPSGSVTCATVLESREDSALQSATSDSCGSTLESGLNQQNQGGSTSSTLKGGIGANGQNGIPLDPDDGLSLHPSLHRFPACAHCGRSDPPPDRWDFNGVVVYLHEACASHWHPPAGVEPFTARSSTLGGVP